MSDDIDTIYVTDTYITNLPDGTYPSGAVVYLSQSSSNDAHYYQTALGGKFQVDIKLTSTQAMVIANIIDYGTSHEYGVSEIQNVVNEAFYESSLGSIMGPNGSHVGLFQYDPTTWASLGHQNLNINSNSDQIVAMFQDQANYEARYSAGISSGTIPQSLSFPDYFEIKHHGGNNDINWTGSAEQGYVSGYESGVSLLGLHYP